MGQLADDAVRTQAAAAVGLPTLTGGEHSVSVPAGWRKIAVADSDRPSTVGIGAMKKTIRFAEKGMLST